VQCGNDWMAPRRKRGVGERERERERDSEEPMTRPLYLRKPTQFASPRIDSASPKESFRSLGADSQRSLCPEGCIRISGCGLE